MPLVWQSDSAEKCKPDNNDNDNIKNCENNYDKKTKKMAFTIVITLLQS